MKQAIVRLVVLAILLANQTLVVYGWDPLPFTEDQIYQGVSTAATIGVAVWAWFKDNPVTKQGKHNEKFLKQRGMK
ncbi:phage holin [Virgibacillus sp. Bac332]|uniref:phage holin n=1 Tax=Virgibacillus sp. Bac332 TaxID=2419842 RepID=UPI000EF49C5E|nr:phage holin [Virgibacillus sp. Bac332]